jgi:hypothetical protein
MLAAASEGVAGNSLFRRFGENALRGLSLSRQAWGPSTAFFVRNANENFAQDDNLRAAFAQRGILRGVL